MAKVYNIEGYNDLFSNFTLVDGVTPDIIKRKYIWLLNATVENAIVGQDSYGFVWYSGTWYSGEWEDGTWYSGIWYDGEWKNGRWYSYRFDTKQLLQRNFRILEKDNPIHSQFRYGIWRDGDFFNGYFGPVDFNTWSTQSPQDVPNPDPKLTESPSELDVLYYQPRWENGTFHNGIFRSSAWFDGKFKKGWFYNSQWLNGTFMDGTFQGHTWWNGSFTGGDFILGIWSGGTFNQVNSTIKSRIGSELLTGTTFTGTTIIWRGGTFLNGEFHSGLNIISGVTYKSTNHNRSWWLNGTYNNGTWYGGRHVNGIHNNGYWLEGIWDAGTFNNGYWENGLWLSGTVNGGQFIHGLFETVTYNKGKFGYQPNIGTLSEQLASKATVKAVPPVILD
jgi:hypothetical protein